MSTDAELLGRFAGERDERAFAELVQRHVSLVYSAALRQLGGDTHLARDVTQVVFATLARKAGALAERASLAGWLYLSAHHAAAEVVRSNQRRRNREQEAHAMHEIEASNGTVADWDRVRPVLDAAMRELGEADREAVLLRYFERRPFGQIGAALNLSEDAARMRVERALDKLRALLARRGITSTQAILAAVLGQEAMVAAPAGLAGVVSSAALTGMKGAAGAGGFLTFMTTPLVTVSAVALVAIGAALFQADQARRAATTADETAREREALRSELSAAQRQWAARLAEAEARAGALQEQLQAAKTTAEPVAAKSAAKPAVAGWSFVSADGSRESVTRFEDTPGGRRTVTRNAVAQTFGAFFRKMGWNESQQDQFKELWADRKEAEQQKIQAAKAAGKPVDRELLKWAMGEAAREFDAKLSAAFGSGVVEAKRDYERKGAFRHASEQLAQRLFYSSTPLVPAQADALAEIMANNARGPDGKYDLSLMNIAAVETQAHAILSQPQLAAWRELDAERQRQTELTQRAREAQEARAHDGR